MRLSTYIRAGRKADGRATDAAVKCLNAPWDEPTRELAHRKWKQADKFHARAVQLADEQHDLIVVQAQLLEQFATAMQETTNGK